jgi:hypothetical protein
MASKYTCLLTKELTVLLLFALCSANVVHGAGKVLVLVDNINVQDTHSIFLNSLKGIKFSGLSYLLQPCNMLLLLHLAQTTDNACILLYIDIKLKFLLVCSCRHLCSPCL